LDVTPFEIINGSWSGKVLSVAGAAAAQVATTDADIV
jgi:hypothetical protein